MNVWIPIDEGPTTWIGFAHLSIRLEDGSGIFLREDGGHILLETQTGFITVWTDMGE